MNNAVFYVHQKQNGWWKLIDQGTLDQLSEHPIPPHDEWLFEDGWGTQNLLVSDQILDRSHAKYRQHCRSKRGTQWKS